MGKTCQEFQSEAGNFNEWQRLFTNLANQNSSIVGSQWQHYYRIFTTWNAQEEFRLILSEPQNGLSFDAERDGAVSKSTNKFAGRVLFFGGCKCETAEIGLRLLIRHHIF